MRTSNRRLGLGLVVCLGACLLPACGPNSNNGADGGSDVGVEPDGNAPDVVEARPAVDLHVVTFNTGRFFDTVCDSGNCSGDSYERQFSQAEFDFKISQIVDGLEVLDADAILLQEVEKRECLDALVAQMPGFSVADFGEIGGTATLDVGIIVRDLEVLETRKHRADTALELSNGETRRFARELLEVHVEKEGERVALFTAHFKAKRDDQPEWRLAEGQKAREIAEATAAEFPEALVLLGGDLNDEPGSPTIDAMTENGGLQFATTEISAEDAWTYRFFGDELHIDHLLYTNEAEAEVVPGSARIVRDQSGAYGGSDHAALEATFRIFKD